VLQFGVQIVEAFSGTVQSIRVSI